MSTTRGALGSDRSFWLKSTGVLNEALRVGASFNYPEAGCVVAEVKDVRTDRVKVTADCDEAGETWESSLFIDLVDDD